MSARHVADQTTVYSDLQDSATSEHDRHARQGLYYPECQTCRREVRGERPAHRKDAVA